MIKLKHIIDFLEKDTIQYEVINANDSVNVFPASLKHIIKNGLYYIVGDATNLASNIEQSIVITDTAFNTQNTLIIVENPQLVHYKICTLFATKADPEIHKTAIIHPEATIGDHVSIGPYCVIGKCKIEDHVILESHVVVKDNSVIKKYVFIDSHSCIGAPGLAWIWDNNGERVRQPQLGGVIIEAYCHLATDVTIVRGSLSESTTIGKSTVIAHGTKIGHGAIIGAHVHMANNVSLAGNAVIGDRSFLGSACIISSNITIPQNTIVGAGAMVNKNFTDAYCTLAGIPAKVIKTENYKHKPKGAPKPFNN
ncbi:hypothetical protein [uncultured Psychroserpens sp.]|uniref:hypothetical protein n=1 Tax=uncultured Psychroserpens sp. TaxID=255436 RepID=UPI00260CA1E8|nr:hypothetical protein [uncultured Psychroserpens sp.]